VNDDDFSPVTDTVLLNLKLLLGCGIGEDGG
jgi:hypothetical protein